MKHANGAFSQNNSNIILSSFAGSNSIPSVPFWPIRKSSFQTLLYSQLLAASQRFKTFEVQWYLRSVLDTKSQASWYFMRWLSMSTSIYAYFGRVLPSRVVILCAGGGVFITQIGVWKLPFFFLSKRNKSERRNLTTNSIDHWCC